MAQTITETQRTAKRERWGFACGAVMALGASLSFAAARAGILAGLLAVDMVFARYIVGGLIMLPLLLRFGIRDLAGIGWPRALVLSLLGGAPFAFLQTGGYGLAPLAHGAIIAPSTVTIVSTVGAALFLRERLSRNHLLGAAVVLVGIVLIGWDGLSQSGGEKTWLGDLMFFASSVLWAGFTLLLRHWRVPALNATAAVTVLSCLVTTPAYLVLMGTGHLAALPLGLLAFQGLVQGGLQSAVTMVAYSQAVMLLGVSRAVLFPAIVPAVSVIVGIPVVGEIPSILQVAGLGLVTLGLLITVGILRRLSDR
ncbi:MAG: DMT family transporter [Pseudomonadota bacterium]